MADGIALPAMGVQVPQPATTQIDPFRVGLEAMQMQNAANQNLQFQLGLQANNAIGDIMSNAPTLEQGLAVVGQSKWAPYASQYLNNMRQMQAALAQTQQTELTTADTAFKNIVRNSAPLYQALQQGAGMDQLEAIYDGAMKNTLAAVPPNYRDKAVAQLQAYHSSLFDGLPADATAARGEVMRRLNNNIATLGLTGPELAQFFGENTTMDTGQFTIAGVRLPPSLGGGFIQSGPPIPKLPAIGATQKPGEVPIAPVTGTPYTGQVNPLGVPPILGAPQAPAAAPAPVAPAPTTAPVVAGPGAPGGAPPPADQTIEGATPEPVPGPAPATAGGAPTPTTPPTGAPPTAGPGSTPAPGVMSSLGTPLYDPSKVRMPQFAGQVGTGNRWIWANPTDEKNAGDLLQHYNDEGTREYDGYNRMRQQLTYIDNSIDQLAQATDAHGLLAPGAFGEQRLALGRAWNTGVDILQQNGFNVGDDAKINPQAMASGEALIKASRILQFSTVTANFGAQREAAQTIATAGKAVPGIENTILGGKLLVESLRSAADRGVDLRNFQNAWLADPRTHGSLQGSLEEFNRLHPPEEYAQATLNKFGLGPNGFQSLDAIDNAVRNRWITPDIASKAAQKFKPQQTGAVTPAPSVAPAPGQVNPLAPRAGGPTPAGGTPEWGLPWPSVTPVTTSTYQPPPLWMMQPQPGQGQ